MHNIERHQPYFGSNDDTCCLFSIQEPSKMLFIYPNPKPISCRVHGKTAWVHAVQKKTFVGHFVGALTGSDRIVKPAFWPRVFMRHMVLSYSVCVGALIWSQRNIRNEVVQRDVIDIAGLHVPSHSMSLQTCKCCKSSGWLSVKIPCSWRKRFSPCFPLLERFAEVVAYSAPSKLDRKSPMTAKGLEKNFVARNFRSRQKPEIWKLKATGIRVESGRIG